ncbi:MAG: transposase, partial [Candidatus Bipolaricaulota bacterium]|nr:transposase [Candidatus Bipolaricaulota bacterium]
MARIARVVLPGIPHHVTQRGVRSLPVFFSDRDRTSYLSFLSKEGEKHGLRFLAWCLMTNHVHLIIVPQEMDSLARGIGEAHKRYTRLINLRQGARGF